MVNWDLEKERILLLLFLKQNPTITFDVDQAIANWHGDPPTPRAAYDRFRGLRRQAQTLVTGTVTINSTKKPAVAPARRRSSGGVSSHRSSNNSSIPTTPTANKGPASNSATPDAPYTANKFKAALSTATSGSNSVSSLLTTNGTNCNRNGNIKVKREKTGTEKNRKRKAKQISLSDDDLSASSDETSEDELSTPTKTMPPPARRLSLPRRSKSITPARYTADEEDDGTGKDSAAIDIESEEEWNGGDEGEKWSVKRGHPKKGWRERVGLGWREKGAMIEA